MLAIEAPFLSPFLIHSNSISHITAHLNAKILAVTESGLIKDTPYHTSHDFNPDHLPLGDNLALN